LISIRSINYIFSIILSFNFPVRPEMYRSRETELALLKGMEVKLNPLVAEVHLPPMTDLTIRTAMTKWITSKSVGLKRIDWRGSNPGILPPIELDILGYINNCESKSLP
jgi:hypothetical protein